MFVVRGVVNAVVAESGEIWTDKVQDWLEDWGRWAKRTTDKLGYPNVSSIAKMVEQARVFERREKTGKRKLREAWKTGDPRQIAEAYGYAEHELTARGKQTRSMKPLEIGEVDPTIMAIERVISTAPGRYQAALYRRYVFGQPDRFAARDLGMSKADYTNRANVAVDYVAENLALRW